MSDNRFTVGDHDYFMKTSPKDLTDAKKAHNRGFREALEDGALLRKGLIKYMREQGVWDDTKEEQYQVYIKKISDLEFKLASGKMKVSEGRALAIELSKVRNEFRELISERNMMDANTAEGQADNARFNFLLVKSVYDWDTQKPVYASLEDYVARGSEPLAMTLASKFANFFYGVDENYDKELVENKFLRRFKLIDEEGRFLNKEGQFIDEEGVLLDKDGYRVDTDGKRVDINGHPLDANIETAEFEED
jgi:hypothetical protein